MSYITFSDHFHWTMSHSFQEQRFPGLIVIEHLRNEEVVNIPIWGGSTRTVSLSCAGSLGLHHSKKIYLKAPQYYSDMLLDMTLEGYLHYIITGHQL